MAARSCELVSAEVLWDGVPDRLVRSFLEAPDQYLRHLLADDP